MSTTAERTPSRGRSAPSIAALQASHEISGTETTSMLTAITSDAGRGVTPLPGITSSFILPVHWRVKGIIARAETASSRCLLYRYVDRRSRLTVACSGEGDVMQSVRGAMMGPRMMEAAGLPVATTEGAVNEPCCDPAIVAACQAKSPATYEVWLRGNPHFRRARLANRCNAARKRSDSSGLICSRKWVSTSSELPPPSSASRMSWALCCSRVSDGQYR